MDFSGRSPVTFTQRKPQEDGRIMVEWKDGTVEWVPLKDLKELYPVELAEYAMANNLEKKPAFHWWIRDTLKKRDRIISKIKSKYWRRTHKFGIRIPKTVEEALRIDQETGTTFGRDAIMKEMSKVKVAFEKLDISVDEMRKGQAKPGYQEIKCHMIFDIKMDGSFTRKARLVTGGHTTETPTSLTYSSVVTRDSVRIAFLLAALNGLDVFAADIGNAYLNAPCREKIWTVAGSEFGSEQGSVMLIVRALYGLKSSGAAWATTFAQSLRDLGYNQCQADPNVWLKVGVKPCGFKYYQLILVYVDDILHISHDPSIVIDALKGLYELKDVGPTKKYLGANVEQVQSDDGRVFWSMNCVDYCKSAIQNVEQMLKSDRASPLKVYGDCNVESTPHLDTDSNDVDRNPIPNMVGGLVGLTPGVEVGSTHGVAVGLVGDVANPDERQPLIDDDAHQLGRDEQSTNGRKFQGASKKVRVDQG
jgi:Reverse transcriptase (RNA-dependent DNA polymerase).